MISEDGTPGLDELRRDLEAVGMVVVPFRDEIHVRRSTLEYIKVRVDGGVLHCEPCVWGMSQARTTWALMAGEVVAIPILVAEFGATSLGLVAAFAGLIAFGFQALRYTLAEVAINRIQSVWLDLRERHRVRQGSSPIALPSPATRELEAGGVTAKEESQAPYVRIPN